MTLGPREVPFPVLPKVTEAGLRPVSLQSWSSPHTKDVTSRDVTVLWVVVGGGAEGMGLGVPWNQQDVRLSLGHRPVVLMRRHSVPKHLPSASCVPDTLLCSRDTTASQRGPCVPGAHGLRGGGGDRGAFPAWPSWPV